MRWIVLAALTFASCAPAAVASDAPPAKCSIVGLGKFIGKTVTLALAAKAAKRAGASTARAIGSGKPVTMDYRRDRLNIYATADGRVDHFTCG